jgi:hypothetical protein
VLVAADFYCLSLFPCVVNSLRSTQFYPKHTHHSHLAYFALEIRKIASIIALFLSLLNVLAKTKYVFRKRKIHNTKKSEDTTHPNKK